LNNLLDFSWRWFQRQPIGGELSPAISQCSFYQQGNARRNRTKDGRTLRRMDYLAMRPGAAKEHRRDVGYRQTGQRQQGRLQPRGKARIEVARRHAHVPCDTILTRSPVGIDEARRGLHLVLPDN
jgi:hypothetical protein